MTKTICGYSFAPPWTTLNTAFLSDGAISNWRAKSAQILLLDWMMPGINGIEVAKALHQDPATTHIPIIMLTAKSQETDKAQGARPRRLYLSSQAVQPLELRRKVRKSLGKRYEQSDDHAPYAFWMPSAPYIRSSRPAIVNRMGGQSMATVPATGNGRLVRRVSIQRSS